MDLAARLKRTGLGLFGRSGPIVAAAPVEMETRTFGTDLARGRDGLGGDGLQMTELLSRILPEDRERLLAAYEAAAHGKSSDSVFRLAGAEEGNWIELAFRTLPAEGGGTRGVTVRGRASTPRMPMTAQGGADPLTRLVYWSAAGGALQLGWADAMRHRAPISLLAIELDEFIALQQLGRPAASRALAGLGPLLARTDGGGFGLRYGVASFVVVMPNCSATVGRSTALRLSRHVSELDVTDSARRERLSVSTGLVTIDPMVTAPGDAVGAAFATLGLAQQAGSPNRHGMLDLRRSVMPTAEAA